MNGFYRNPPGRHSENAAEPLALRLREAAAAISVSTSTLDRLTKDGVIPCVRLFPPTAKKRQRAIVLYEVAVLREYLSSSRRVVGQEVVS